jgi:predicted aldo/keto reductase-like oxidoreductase
MRFREQDGMEGGAALVRTAYDAGVNYFDTAIGYGKSEEIFGLAFKMMSQTRKERPFYVASKTFAADESSVRKELDISLKRMGLEYLDFYHVWCVMSPEAWRDRKSKGVLQAFEKIRGEGLIRNIVVSSHMTGADIGSMLDDYDFKAVLLGYSAMNFAYREAALEAAARKKMGVVVMNPLGGGVIPQNPDRFGFVKTRPDETVTTGAIRFLLNDRRISTVLVGFSTPEQVAEAVSAADGFRPIPPETIERIRAEVKSSFNEMCTGCGYCDDCPEKIPIPKLMDAYNHYMFSGNYQDILNRLNWHWGIQASDGSWNNCTECGQCESACTQHLPIIRRLKEIGAEIDRISQTKA